MAYMGSGQDKYLHLWRKLSNPTIPQRLKPCFWHRKEQLKAVLILKRQSGDAVVPLRLLEKGKLHTSLVLEKRCAEALPFTDHIFINSR